MFHSTQRLVQFNRVVFICLMLVNRGLFLECQHTCRVCGDDKGKAWCNFCIKGYYWAKGQCFECDKNCNNCNSLNCVHNCEHNFGECVSGCKTGYKQHRDTETEAYSCRCRVPNCNVCDSMGCTTCEDGYFFQNGQCEVCDVSYCKTCKSQNNCHTCEDGYFLQNGQCEACDVSHCKTCKSQNNCHTCQDGYYLQSRQQCLKDMPVKGSPKTDNTVTVGTAVGGTVLLIACIVVAVIVSRRRNRGRNGNNVDKETANFPNVDIGLQNRVEEGSADSGTNGSQCNISEEESTYASPNKFRTEHMKKKEAKQNEPQKSGIEAPAWNEPPTLPIKSNLYYDDSDLEEFDPNLPDDNDDTGHVPEDCDTYYNTSTFIRRRMTKEALLVKIADHKIDSFKDEFERLADGLTRDYKEALKPENRPRNRYNLVYPYDVTRVIIADSKSNYINASYIDGYNHPKAYIACLGPTASTTDKYEQFWRMIWQEDVEKIVMLTCLMEGSTMKCEQYWPNKNNVEKYGEITVKNILESNCAEYIVRTLKVIKNQEERDVSHIHFTAWPDKNVPDDVISLLEFRQKVIAAPTRLEGPTVVHCSAGIGRTGTYIALDILIQEGKQEQSVDVFGCVNGIRGQRTKLVQNLPQYMYIHYALVHELTFGNDILSADQFHINISDGQKEVLRQQFRAMQQSNRKYLSDEEAAAVQRNRKKQHKNRRDADIPGYRNRVKLRNQRTPGSGDYINAVYINGFLPGSHYIVAQTPLPSTIVDFVDLLVQENVHSIVSMDPANVPNESVGSILPTDDQDLTIGPYTVRCHKQSTMDGYVCRELEITQSDKAIQKKKVFHYQCLIWDMGAQTPSSSSVFVRMVRDREIQAASANSAVLIHCLKAAERSCLYCAVSMLTHKIENEQKVNVINIITRIRARRPMAIPNEDQFIFCHECVAEFIESTGSQIAYTNVAVRS